MTSRGQLSVASSPRQPEEEEEEGEEGGGGGDVRLLRNQSATVAVTHEDV